MSARARATAHRVRRALQRESAKPSALSNRLRDRSKGAGLGERPTANRQQQQPERLLKVLEA